MTPVKTFRAKMQPSDKQYRTMKIPTVREIVSCLIGRDHVASIGEVATQARSTPEVLQEAIAVLQDEGWITRENSELPFLEQKLFLTHNPALIKLITQAMLAVEDEFVATRAAEVSWHAAEKLRAIDSLADAIFIARKSLRKDADIH